MIVAVGLIAFSMFRFVGDPVLAIMGRDASPAERSELRRGPGPDDPIVNQFGRFAAHAARAARGDFGLSLQHGRPVAGLFLERLPCRTIWPWSARSAIESR